MRSINWKLQNIRSKTQCFRKTQETKYPLMATQRQTAIANLPVHRINTNNHPNHHSLRLNHHHNLHPNHRNNRLHHRSS